MTDGPSRPALLKEIERLKAELETAKASVQPHVDRVIYVDNPAHLETIRALQAQIAGMQ